MSTEKTLRSIRTPIVGERRDYKLVVDDFEAEIRSVFVGEQEVPWAPKNQGKRFESTVQTIKEGFVLPKVFLDRWQNELSKSLVNYWQISESQYADFGWVLYESPESKEGVCVKFKQPLTFFNWPIIDKCVKTTAPAYIMKFRTISLSDPRDTEKEKPQLEGDLMATLVCENFVVKGEKIVFDYELKLTGLGIMRYHHRGVQVDHNLNQVAFAGDKGENCNIEITKKGRAGFSTSLGLIDDNFTETWYAKSIESEMFVNESSISGPDQNYSLFSSELPKRETKIPKILNVRNYGATGDGNTLDTPAINAAIEAASDELDGGIVYFPPGVYLSGSVHMKSNVTLKLHGEATLKGTGDISQYDTEKGSRLIGGSIHHSLIWGEKLTNIALLGPGQIVWDPDVSRALALEKPTDIALPSPGETLWDSITLRRGVRSIGIRLCENILIKDITIINSVNKSITVEGCDYVLVDGYTSHVRVDGFQPISCHNVTITNSDIWSGDDSIVIKSSYDLGRSSENITAKNCVLTSPANAMKIGTESNRDFKNIVIKNLLIYNPQRTRIGREFGGLVIICADGGTIDGVIVTNVRMINVDWPLFIRLGDRIRVSREPSIGAIQNVSISNVVATGGIGIGTSSITGLPNHPIRDVVLNNINITSRGGGQYPLILPVPDIRESKDVYPNTPMFGMLPSHGLYCRNVKGLELHNTRLRTEDRDERPQMIYKDVDGLVLDGLEAQSEDEVVALARQRSLSASDVYRGSLRVVVFQEGYVTLPRH